MDTKKMLWTRCVQEWTSLQEQVQEKIYTLPIWGIVNNQENLAIEIRGIKISLKKNELSTRIELRLKGGKMVVTESHPYFFKYGEDKSGKSIFVGAMSAAHHGFEPNSNKELGFLFLS